MGSWAVEIGNNNTDATLLLLIAALRTDIPIIMRDQTATETEQEAIREEFRRLGISIVSAADDDHLQNLLCVINASTTSKEAVSRPLLPNSFVLSSGGSSGRPKLVVDAGLRQSSGGNTRTRVTTRLNWSADQIQLVTGRLHHAAPLTFFMYGLLDGNQLVVPSRFVPSAAVRIIEDLRVNWFEATPFQLQSMAAWLQRHSANLECLRGLLHMASPCPPATKQFWHTKIGPERVFEMYGATEGIGTTIANGTEWLARPGTVGRGYFTQVRILDEAMVPQPRGQVGLVFMRTLGRTKSTYLRGGNSSLSPDGFLSVGDRGHLDNDGYLFLEPRMVDLLNVAGENVYPAEIERVLVQCPGIADAGVTGVPDAKLGVRPIAFVTHWPGEIITQREVIAFCGKHLARFKVPKQIVVIDEIPRNSAGKIDRVGLAALIVSDDAGKLGARTGDHPRSTTLSSPQAWRSPPCR